ncbi:MAG: hypothetical protein KKB25_01085 [Nanoarchaeota archaeon]|nr:hypothetical protein [Nanoarchaeota archaeon]
MYISSSDEYIIDPCPGQHLTFAPAINIRDTATVSQKLFACLDIAEQRGYKNLNLHLVGSAYENPSTLSDKIIKKADFLGFINTPRALKGEINMPYQWTGINEIREKYLPKIKELREFGVSFGKFACARCAATDGIRRAVQIAGNDEGITILYNGVEEKEISDMFQKFFNEGIVQIL